jgi:hypothetical protein
MILNLDGQPLDPDLGWGTLWNSPTFQNTV